MQTQDGDVGSSWLCPPTPCWLLLEMGLLPTAAPLCHGPGQGSHRSRGTMDKQQLKRRSLGSCEINEGTRKLNPHIALLYMEPSKIQRCQRG